MKKTKKEGNIKKKRKGKEICVKKEKKKKKKERKKKKTNKQTNKQKQQRHIEVTFKDE